MAALDWPFCPLTPVTEALQWATDVMRAKTTEQRVGLRRRPRRSLNYSHILTDEQANTAKGLIRAAQGGDGFNVPDWTNAANVGVIASGNPSISATIEADFWNNKAFIWESPAKNETVSISSVTSSGFTAAGVTNSYTNAFVMPAFTGDCPSGMDQNRRPADINNVSVEFVLTELFDVAATTYADYKSADVLPSCPIIGGGSFSESALYPVTSYGNVVGVDEWERARDLPDVTFDMRWHLFTEAEIAEVVKWLHSRRGRLKQFWLSSYGRDFVPAAGISGTTLTVFTDNGMRAAPFDVEIKAADGTSYYREVTAAAAGSVVDGRATSDLTLDSSVTLAKSAVRRVSMLRAARFNVDRIELSHAARGGVVIVVPCIEVPEP